jgi:hypothetical protein
MASEPALDGLSVAQDDREHEDTGPEETGGLDDLFGEDELDEEPAKPV